MGAVILGPDIKPDQWGFDLGFVSPEFQDFWLGGIFAVPLWAEDAISLDGQQIGTVGGNANLDNGAFGPRFKNGTTGLISYANDPSFDLPGNEISISILFTMSVLPQSLTDGGIVDNTAGNNDGYKLLKTGSGGGTALRWRLAGGGGNLDQSITNKWAVGDLLFMEVSFDGSTQALTLYNLSTGEKTTKSRAATQASLATGDPLHIGHDQAFGGSITELELYYVVIRNRARPVAEIDAFIGQNDPFGPFRMVEEVAFFVPAAGGIPFGIASETDTSLSMAAMRTYSLNVASEIDSALTTTAVRAYALSIASETDTALLINLERTLGIGVASEVDTARAMILPSILLLGIASEADTAAALTAIRTHQLGIAAETNTARILNILKTVQLGLPAETDTALVIIAERAVALGIASETDAALAMAALKTGVIGMGIASETDIALALTILRTIALNIAATSTSALPMQPQRTYSLGLPSETDTARSIGPLRAHSIGIASETNTVEAMTVSGGAAKVILGVRGRSVRALTSFRLMRIEAPGQDAIEGRLTVAQEIDTALAMIIERSHVLGVAVETDTTLAMVAERAYALGIGAEVDTVLTLSIARTYALGIAQETDTGRAVTAERAYALGRTEETDTARAVSISRALSLSIAAEAASARAIQPHRTYGLNVIQEIDTAIALTIERTLGLAVAIETNTARTMTPTLGINFFVDASVADETGDGTFGDPWKTLAQVNLEAFSANDVIALKRGEEWRETLTTPSSGTSGNPITFTAYGSGADPLINGADFITVWTNTSGDVWEAAAPDQIRNVFLNGTKQLQGVEGGTANDYASTTDDGSTITDSIASVESAGDGAWWWDDSVNKLYIHNSSGVDPGDEAVEGGIRTYCVDINSKNYVTVENIEGKYADTAIFEVHGSSDNTIIDNVTASFAYFSGIHLGGTSTNSVVQNSTAFSNGRLLDSGNPGVANNGHGINISTTGSVTLVTLNESYDNAEDGCQVNGSSTTSYVITFNNWHENHEDGQDLKEGDITNSFVTDNHIWGNHVRGLQMIGSLTGVNAHRNEIHNNGSAGIWVAGAGGTYKFHSNLIYDNGDPTKNYTSSEFHGMRLQPTASFTSVEIYNNTIISGVSGGECIEFINVDSDNVDVQSNILQIITVTTEEAFKVQNIVTGLIEQDNLVRNAHATGNIVIRIVGSTYNRADINDGPPSTYTIGEGDPIGVGTEDADPDFFDAGSDDYRLKNTSPAFETGVAGLVEFDIDGVAFDISNPNKGCYAGSA